VERAGHDQGGHNGGHGHQSQDDLGIGPPQMPPRGLTPKLSGINRRHGRLTHGQHLSHHEAGPLVVTGSRHGVITSGRGLDLME
jgi:hypothetical protein